MLLLPEFFLLILYTINCVLLYIVEYENNHSGKYDCLNHSKLGIQKYKFTVFFNLCYISG